MKLTNTAQVIYRAAGAITLRLILTNSTASDVVLNMRTSTQVLNDNSIMAHGAFSEYNLTLAQGDEIIAYAGTDQAVDYVIKDSNNTDITPAPEADIRLAQIDGLFTSQGITGATVQSLNAAQLNTLVRFIVYKLGGMRSNGTIKKPSNWT